MESDERKYGFLLSNKYCIMEYCLVPLREEDMELIMKWRNEQIDVLRQKKPLTKDQQHDYFNQVVMKSFRDNKPDCVLFSFLINYVCIGYGGLVHIDWKSKTAELSFIVDTNRYTNKNLYESDFNSFLTLISEIVFEELKFKKLFAETYDLRPHHIEILEKFGFKEEKRIKSKVKIDGKYVDSVLHVYENSCKPK